MNNSPQKQNVIKLDGSKLLGHNAQGIVMAGPKPVGTVKPTSPKPSTSIGGKPVEKKNAIKLDGSKLLGHDAQGVVMVAGTKPLAIKPTIGVKPKVG